MEDVNGGLERLFHALGDQVGTRSAPGNASSHRFATSEVSLKGDNFEGKSQLLSTVKEIDILAPVSVACAKSVGSTESGASVKLHAIFRPGSRYYHGNTLTCGNCKFYVHVVRKLNARQQEISTNNLHVLYKVLALIVVKMRLKAD